MSLIKPQWAAGRTIAPRSLTELEENKPGQVTLSYCSYFDNDGDEDAFRAKPDIRS
jgi:hypothetical protein